MTKKGFNQNAKYVQELINSVENNFVFSNLPINRFKMFKSNNDMLDNNKIDQLSDLKKQINSIKNCNLKDSSKNLIMGEGNINSSIMLIGEAPGILEDNSGKTFEGDVGTLLKKMLLLVGLH